MSDETQQLKSSDQENAFPVFESNANTCPNCGLYLDDSEQGICPQCDKEVYTCPRCFYEMDYQTADQYKDEYGCPSCENDEHVCGTCGCAVDFDLTEYYGFNECSGCQNRANGCDW
jgi:hypothetical protein